MREGVEYKKAAQIHPTRIVKKLQPLQHRRAIIKRIQELEFSFNETTYPQIEKTRKTILAVGDCKGWDYYTDFIGQKKTLSSNPTALETVSYADALEGRFPEIKGRNIVVLLFFPFEYWDKNIETKDYEGVYGNREFIKKFKKFWKLFQIKIGNAYNGGIIHYINPPSAVCLERDKEKTKMVLARNGIPVPKSLTTRCAKEIMKMLEKGRKLYIKVRYGSTGKGISYFDNERWTTNFNFENGRIICRKSDFGWRFREMTGNLKFLEELLKTDVVVEEAIEPMLVNVRRFDIRFYVCMGEVLRKYARSNNLNAVTTNISQGAKAEEQDFLLKIPQDSLEAGRIYALKTAKAMGLELAGVDVIIDEEGNPFVLEANSFPGFRRQKNFNLSARIFEKIEEYRF